MREEGEQDLDLDRVIAAVAGRDPVDWGSETARRPDLGPLLEELRVMASVAAAHHGVPADIGERELTQWGPLRVLERVGRGGFCDVYRAFDPRLETVVALKLIRPEFGHETRIVQEARRMARVRHANVLTVHGADRHQGRAGMWTDLIDGQTLEDLLAANGPLGADEATRIGLDLCRALAAVHAARLVHRDVKTLNVMRERGGRIVLMDFGAGIEQRPDGSDDLPEDGTLLIMAPEDLRGEPVGPASDLYSLGVLLYRLVTRCFPVEARTYGELMALHERGEHARLRDRRPDLPGSFVRVVERALEVSVERRFRSAGEFERSLMGSGKMAIPAVSPPPPRPPAGTRRKAGWLAAGLGLALIVSLVILRPWENPPRPSEPRQAVPGAPVSGWTAGEQAPDPAPPQTASGAERHPPGDLPGPVGSAGTARPFVASAALLCERDGHEQTLAPGDRVMPGEGLFLKFQAGERVHVYVLNEDAAGEIYVLFPAPGTELTNPLAPGVLHRLPGSRAGQYVNWQVTSAGGKETVIVIASPEPARALERELARLPRASRDRPLALEAAGEREPSTSRGIGGMTESKSPDGNVSRPRLSDMLRRLAASRELSAPWIWQIELENPR